MRALFAVMAVAALAGCASTPVPLSQAKPIDPSRVLAFQEPIAGESAKLTVIRDGRVGVFCYRGLWIDGKLAARIAAEESATFIVPAGERLLRVASDPQGRGACPSDSDERWTQRETILRPGEHKVFRLTISEDGIYDVMRTN